MNYRIKTLVRLGVVAALFISASVAIAGEKVVGPIDFSKIEPGAIPDDFLVINGEFAVRDLEGNRVLELPGTPLESFGALFGPAFNPKTDSAMTVTGRLQGEGKGRRQPAFGLGVCGVGGYRLQVTPSKKALELFSGEEVITSKPFVWKDGAWMHLRLRISKAASPGAAASEGWKVEGRAWLEGQAEPGDWPISLPLDKPPVSGRPSVWGLPYSGLPIQFDDLVVTLQTEKE